MNRRLWIIIAGLLLFLARMAPAGTIIVPTEEASIQAGIDAAATGDTVLVLSGTYSGEGNLDIRFGASGVTLLSLDGPTVTIIDCAGLGRAFTLRYSIGPDPTIDGFTIMNGYGGNQGGAMECFAYSPIIKNCVFVNNVAVYGGALYFNGALGKSVDEFGSYPIIVNCTFVGNIATAMGSVCHHNYGALTTLSNCIVYDNTSGAGGPPLRVGQGDGGTSLACCDVFGNNPEDYTGEIADQSNVSENVSVDPGFCDEAAGDYRLQPNSPCTQHHGTCGQLIGALGPGCGPCDDVDVDLICDIYDNCPTMVNFFQEDWNSNGIGDVCDDSDGDGHIDNWDNCRADNNPEQIDSDQDRIGDVCDNCPEDHNPAQNDADQDGIGDACDSDPDGDGYANQDDNCPEIYNPSQDDTDADGVGDLCDVCEGLDDTLDRDGDCIIDDSDNCPDHYNPSQGCCCGLVGNANGVGGDEPTISDISRLIDVLFICSSDCILSCLTESDINQSGGVEPNINDITIADISVLIDYLFITGPSLGLHSCLEQ